MMIFLSGIWRLIRNRRHIGRNEEGICTKQWVRNEKIGPRLHLRLYLHLLKKWHSRMKDKRGQMRRNCGKWAVTDAIARSSFSAASEPRQPPTAYRAGGPRDVNRDTPATDEERIRQVLDLFWKEARWTIN
jgi:hypothetical protein